MPKKHFGESEAFHKNAYKHETRTLRNALTNARVYLKGDVPIAGTKKCAWAFEALLKAAGDAGAIRAHGASGDFSYRWRGGRKGSTSQYKLRGVGMKQALKAAVRRFHAKCILADRE